VAAHFREVQVDAAGALQRDDHEGATTLRFEDDGEKLGVD